MKLKTKFKIISVVVIGLILTVGFFVFIQVQELEEAIEENRAAAEIMRGVFELNLLTNDYLLHLGERNREQWQSRHQSIEKLFQPDIFEELEEQMILDNLRKNHEAIQTIFLKLVENLEGQELGEAESISLELKERLVVELLVRSQTMLSGASHLMDASRAELANTQQKTALFIMISVAVLAGIILLVLLVVVRGILGPVLSLQKGAEIIGAGDLEHRIDIKSKDEIGILTQAFNKMVENLSKEITRRRKAEERLIHINAVLRALRGVNQLITKEKDRDRLLQGTCNILVQSRGYQFVWVALFNKSGKLIKAAEAGLGKDFLPIVKQLKRGKLPICVQKALAQSDIVIIKNPRSVCGPCYLVDKHQNNGAMAIRLEHKRKIYGVLVADVSLDLITDKEEEGLFKELAGDLAFALQGVEREEKRREAEEETKELQEYLQLQVTRMPIGLIVWDKEFRVKTWNPAATKIFGFKAKEALGKHPYELIVPKEAQPQVDKIWSRLIKGDETAHSVNENITKDGRTIICSWANTPLKDDDHIIGVLSMVQDITKEKKAEEAMRKAEIEKVRAKEAEAVAEELKKLDKMKDEFLDIASHELRTPLTAIRGNISLMKEHFPEKLKDGKLKEIVSDVHESSVRLIGLVNDFLDVSRLEGEKIEFKKKEFDLKKLVQEVINELEGSASEKALYLRLEKSKDRLPNVSADKERTRQVIVNLLGNAIKFTKKGGVTVKIEKGARFVKVKVNDTGIGIPKENQKLLFQKFQQVGKRVLARDVTRGTGLGLYIARMLVEGMGGKIYLERSVIGKGSTFAFELPKARGKDK